MPEQSDSSSVLKAQPMIQSPGVVLVTGASSGIGWETALLLAEQGWTVFAASRSIKNRLDLASLDIKLGRSFQMLELDVLDDESCQKAVSDVISQAGRIDALIHCAGAGLAGSVEEIPIPDAIWQYDNLLFGTIRMVHAVLPQMRHQGAGRMILVSSVAAAIPVPFQTYYSSAKAAIHALALGLSDEVRPFGLKITLIAPGDTRTGFTSARKISGSHAHSPYAQRLHQSVSRMAHDEQNGMPSSTIARAIVREMNRHRPRLCVTPGLAYQAMTLASRLLPLQLVRWIVRLLYA